MRWRSRRASWWTRQGAALSLADSAARPARGPRHSTRGCAGDGLPRITQVEAGPDAWYWGAPLPDGTFDAMVFVDAAAMRAGSGKIDERFGALLARSRLLSACASAVRASPVHARDATPYMNEACAGDDFIQLGDAALALDPLTLDFEDLVAWLTREMNITAVTRLVHISWVTVGDIVKRVVRRKLPEGRLERLYLIGLDEVSYRKGHKYISIIADHQSGSPVWMAEGRSQATIAAFFDTLGPERCAQLTAVSMDMSAAYFAEVQNRAPNAQIAFDPFHVVQLGNKALQEIRRTEAREHSDSNHGKVLKGARWTLLKASEDLKVHERLHLAEVARLNARVPPDPNRFACLGLCHAPLPCRVLGTR